MEGSYEACAAAAAWVAERAGGPPPTLGLVCGSGLGALAEGLSRPQSFDYAELPHFPRSTVPGHAGRLVLGWLGGCRCAVLQGRFHLYEGYSPAQVAMPVRTLRLLGARTLLLTNAAGSLRPDLTPGDLLVLRDHLDLPGLAGRSPLAGPNDERFGPRFPAVAGAYDASLRALALRLAARVAPELRARPGVYCGVGGPGYETAAEGRFLRRAGADAVGMSTVHEAVAGRHCGLRLLGLSLITNMAAGATHDGDDDDGDDGHDGDDDGGHDAVLAAARRAVTPLRALRDALARHLAREEEEEEAEGRRDGDDGDGDDGDEEEGRRREAA
ncbi:purine nucleoside phosphorylase [Dromaius novaehollandiae]|uniref:purine nucleoside phosphorylase n=1 Tax=Dromaius novaehollandiae TaxID=8790 RepID=UPI00311DD2A5